MKANKFNKGQQVNVVKNNGEVILEGVISQCDINLCTFGIEYDVDYEKEGRIWTMICIPEKNVQLI